ncbi:MAG: prolyl oligopeptidase family serine peptidase [Chloroflexi bacterium]|nr:prolyl oligopeptidase family serine peptidase [Chloroflexota bacterium]
MIKLFRISRRRIVTIVVATLAAFAVLLFGASWYYSGAIEEGAFKIDHEPDEFDLEIVSASDNRVSFEHPSGDGRWIQPGKWGIEWDGGSGQVGALLSDDDGVATRDFSPLDGLPTPGVAARLSREVFPGDPLTAHGLPFEDVDFAAQLGELGAWLIGGDDDIWVIHVHGRAGGRDDALRVLPVIERAGMTSLVIDYRNDPGVFEDPSSYYLYGITEWQDVESAVRYALDSGAKSVVPYGYSMGGAIVMSFLYNSPLATSVSGVVLDAPMLDLGRVVEQAAADRHVPGFVTSTARFMTEQRFDVEFDDMGYLGGVDRLTTPILLFHGDSDDRVPVETSDELAEARPDLVTYERVADAEHVHAWNIDPERYESAVETFLASASGSR